MYRNRPRSLTDCIATHGSWTASGSQSSSESSDDQTRVLLSAVLSMSPRAHSTYGSGIDGAWERRLPSNQTMRGSVLAVCNMEQSIPRTTSSTCVLRAGHAAVMTLTQSLRSAYIKAHVSFAIEDKEEDYHKKRRMEMGGTQR